MLDKWDERPQDLSNLLNPAFLGLLLHKSVLGFKKEADAGMPFELVSLVLPFVLHPATRNRLPTKISTTLPTWLQLNRDVLVSFPKRTRELLPFTREALSFLIGRGVLVFNDHGLIDAGAIRPTSTSQYQEATEEIAACCKRAEFVGRWLALAGSVTTIYVLLGIRP
jgi:hypothetical protein